MLHELSAVEFDSVLGLFEPLGFRLDCLTALDGSLPGRVWVDDADSPRAAFLTTNWAWLLAGTPTDDVCRALNRFITEVVFRGDPMDNGRKGLRITPEPGVWDDAMSRVLAGREPIVANRRSYLHDLEREPPEFPLPDGCRLAAIDRKLLDDPEIEVNPRLVRSMKSGFGSADHFLEKLFSCVAVMDGKTVSTAIGMHPVGTLCEMGIGTRDEYLRQGLGVATTAGGLRLAKSRGFTSVSWQCSVRNQGSVRIAEKVGFEFEREYTGYMVFGEEELHAQVLADWKEGKHVF